MNLTKIEIECYKCFINQVFEINDRCIGFVGLNESGKSNLLQAIRMLGWDVTPTQKDKSKLNNGLPSVSYHFQIEDNSYTARSIARDISMQKDASWYQFIEPSSVKISGIKVIT